MPGPGCATKELRLHPDPGRAGVAARCAGARLWRPVERQRQRQAISTSQKRPRASQRLPDVPEAASSDQSGNAKGSGLYFSNSTSNRTVSSHFFGSLGRCQTQATGS